MDNLILNIPKESVFFIGADHTAPNDQLLKEHHSVLIASITNNQRILKSDDFDSKWIFQTDERSTDFQHGYLNKHLKLIKNKDLNQFTSMRTAIDSENAFSLVCVLPTQVISEQMDPVGKLVNAIQLTNIFSLKRVPNFLNYDSIIRQIRTENQRFWDQHKPDNRVLNIAFSNRRFRNEKFTETDDYPAIQNMNTPQRIDGYVFLDEDGNQKDISGNDDGLDFKGELRAAMGIQPLNPNDYESYLTYQEMEDIFCSIALFENRDEILVDLYEVFLKSFFCCHLIFHNPIIMRKLHLLYQQLNRKCNQEKCSQYRLRIHRSLTWGMYTLYAEELLLGGNLTTKHRSVWNLECASLLPRITGANLYESPYLCLPLAPKAMALHANSIGVPRIQGYGWNTPDHLKKFFSKGLPIRGVHYNHQVRTNLIFITRGILEGLNDPEIFLTGSAAEACLYNNPLFRKGNQELSVTYPERDPNHSGNQPTYKHSDLDLVSFTEDPEVFEKKLESIKQILELNLSEEVNCTKINDYKYRITSPSMHREIDFFRTNKNPAALLYNYHISTCRAIIPLGNSDNTAKQSAIMTSMVISCHVGMCVDRRWFTSKSSLYDRICRQLCRGIGLLLNCYEIQMLKEYTSNSPQWRFISHLIDININQGAGSHRNNYVFYLPKVQNEIYGPKTKAAQVGPYFINPASIKDTNYNPTHGGCTYIRAQNTSYRYIPGRGNQLRSPDGSFINN